MRIVSDLIQGYFHKLKNQGKSPLQLAAQEIWWEGTFEVSILCNRAPNR